MRIVPLFIVLLTAGVSMTIVFGIRPSPSGAQEAISAKLPEELGRVAWLRDYRVAVERTKKTDQPILILFDEVPGCSTCKTFGNNPLSHPIIVDAAQEFSPVAIRPGPAEIARPSKQLQATEKHKEPDPQGRIERLDGEELIVTSTIVPANPKPGQVIRVHLEIKWKDQSKLHWNNEAEPLQLWLNPPQGSRVSEQSIRTTSPKVAQSREVRRLEFELQTPPNSGGPFELPAYALFHVCDDEGGQCRFVRLDLKIEVCFKK